MFLRFSFFSLFLFVLLIPAFPFSASALSNSELSELEEQIEEKLRQKAALDEENKKLQAQINQTNAEAKTLQSAVKTLDTTQKKLQSDIQVTQNKIGTTELSIQKLGIEIVEKENAITGNKAALAETIRRINESDDASFVQTMLQYRDVSELWNALETIHQFQTSIQQHTNELVDLKADLQEKKSDNEDKKQDLTDYKGQLGAQKTVVDQNKQAKSKLLTETQNKEAEYQKMLARNIELGKKFEQELFAFQAQLQAVVDKSKLPTTKSGVLSWPLASVTITQHFGRTSDSGRLYVSGTHNGVDFRASVGTPVLAAGDGTVTGMGNTDDQPGCYSYGRWVLIDHHNGLSSMYAHLSAQSGLSVGKAVRAGQVIGYSGGQPGMAGSGYSTGPHLHFGIFASQAVTVQKYTSSNFCKQVSIPIAGINAYLDPLAYLPPLN